jgi:hypothetical protein
MRGCGRIARPAFPAPSEFQMRFNLAKLARERAARSRRCGCECRGGFIPPTCGVETSEARSVGGHIVSGANDVPGGACFGMRGKKPHPALRATLPIKKGRDKKARCGARRECGDEMFAQRDHGGVLFVPPPRGVACGERSKPPASGEGTHRTFGLADIPLTPNLSPASGREKIGEVWVCANAA